MPKSIKNGAQIYQNDALGGPGGLWGASRLQECETRAPWKLSGNDFCSIWLIFCAILGPAGFQRGPQIDNFGIKSQRNEKNEVQVGVAEKAIIFYRNLIENCEVWGCRIIQIHWRLQRIRDFHLCGKDQ